MSDTFSVLCFRIDWRNHCIGAIARLATWEFSSHFFLKCVVLSYVIISFRDCTYKFIQLHIYVSILFGLKHFIPKFDIMASILTCKLSRFYFK